MVDSKTTDNGFYFECTNPNCDVAYYSKHFLDSIFLWGFIFLTNGKEYLIGITCVDCMHTSIRNFKSIPDNFPFNLESRVENFKVELKHYVPFSPEILSELLNNTTIPLEENPKSEDLFYVPEGFTPIVDYTDKLMESLLPIKINIKDIEVLDEYENQHGLKVFPRIVAQNSVYHISEGWVTDRNMEQLHQEYQEEDESYFQDVHNSLVSLVKNGFKIKNDPAFESKQIVCENIIENDLTPEQYSEMDFSLDPWREDYTNDIVFSFLCNYNGFRNSKNFELTCYNKFFNAYAEDFYYNPDYGESIECDFNSSEIDSDLNPNQIESLLREFEEINTMQQHQNLLVDKKTLPIKSMSGEQLMKRWGLDGFEIINLVLSYNLSAYDLYYFKYLTKNKFQKDFGKLLSGDIEEQKKAVNRFRFDPKVVLKFEKDNPDLLETAAKSKYQFSEDTMMHVENDASDSQPEKTNRQGKWSMPLSELSEIKQGLSFEEEQVKQKGDFLVLRDENIQTNKITLTNHDKFIDILPNDQFNECIVSSGDILVCSTLKQIYVYKKNDPPSVISENFTIIRSEKNEYIKTYLLSNSGQKALSVLFTIEGLRQTPIPILPLDDLNKASENNLITSNSSELAELKKQLNSMQINDHVFQKEILHRIEVIENKIDKILKGLEELQNSIQNIKSTKRKNEEKLQLIYSKMEKEFKIINNQCHDEILVYEELVKVSIDNWDKLDVLSKEILPIGEYLFDRLNELDNPDYSPVILQFCKSLETEFLMKLFREFTISINQEVKDIDDFLRLDFQKGKKTNLFAKHIKKYRNKEAVKIKYTFGVMNRILQLTLEKNTIKGSPLLKKFKKFILLNFKDETLFSKEYLNGIQEIINKYRNECAHPNKLSESQAIRCKEMIPGDIDRFLFSWNK